MAIQAVHQLVNALSDLAVVLLVLFAITAAVIFMKVFQSDFSNPD